METKRLDMRYSADRDILIAIIPPPRPARMGGGEYGCMIGYADDNTREVVSFEILDFSRFITHLHEPGVLPEMDARFDVVETEVSVDADDGTVHRETHDTGLRNVTLREALEWAYRHYILSHLPNLHPIRVQRQHVPAAVPS